MNHFDIGLYHLVGHFQFFDITMAASDNPFAMPTDTTGMNTARHGSAEQNAGAQSDGTYLNSMTGNTPPVTPPRTRYILPEELVVPVHDPKHVQAKRMQIIMNVEKTGKSVETDRSRLGSGSDSTPLSRPYEVIKMNWLLNAFIYSNSTPLW